ncbi:MAG: hypothetical protein M1155_00260 [Patescibacteria group bacterium]|nr:hypothetical protein [Patescibacteria group bacterium]
MKKIDIRKIIFVGLLVAVFLLIPHSFAHAQQAASSATQVASNAPSTPSALDFITNPGKSIMTAVSWILTLLLYVLGYFFHLALFLGGIILNWVLELNSNIVDNPAVQIGWPITRDIANLAFVFLIIIIAFETILNTGSLQVKKALPKLIIAALLINFSLLLATVVLDFAGMLTNFFLASFNSQSGNGGVAQALSSAMQMYKVLQPPTLDPNSTLLNFGAATVQVLASLIFADIITAVGAITMFGLAAMFLMRYVIIGILLITLPAAIIGWVIGGSGWSDWSKKFLQQTFFGPIAGFYIYIALKSYTAIQGIVDTPNMQKALVDDPSHVIQSMGPNIGSMIMVVAILMYGIKKAEEGSGIAGKWTTNAATGAINGILKGTASTAIGLTGLGFAAKKVGEFGEKYKNSKYGLVRSATRPLRQVAKSSEDFQKTYGGLSGIYTATSEEIGAGLGWNSRKLRLKEEKEYKEKENERTENEKTKQAGPEKEFAEKEKLTMKSALTEEEGELNKKWEEKMLEIDAARKNPQGSDLSKLEQERDGIAKALENVRATKTAIDQPISINQQTIISASQQKEARGNAGGGDRSAIFEKDLAELNAKIAKITNPEEKRIAQERIINLTRLVKNSKENTLQKVNDLHKKISESEELIKKSKSNNASDKDIKELKKFMKETKAKQEEGK